MKLLLVAVGTRMPAWVDTGFDDFAKRMPRELPLQLIEVKAEPRTTGKTVEAMMALEAARIEAALPPRCRRRTVRTRRRRPKKQVHTGKYTHPAVDMQYLFIRIPAAATKKAGLSVPAFHSQGRLHVTAADPRQAARKQGPPPARPAA